MKDKDMKWRTLSSHYLFKKPWMTARVDKVELPTGVILDEYYVLEYPDWVNTIAITKDGKFVFVCQYRYAIGKTVNELCAGVCEKGEDPMDSAKRELLEETGFGGGEWQHWMDISANPGTHTNITHCYIARGVERISTQHLDEGECLEVRIFTRDEVYQMLTNNEIWQSLMAAPLWKLFVYPRRGLPNVDKQRDMAKSYGCPALETVCRREIEYYLPIEKKIFNHFLYQHILYQQFTFNKITYAQSKFFFPAPISKCSLAMPISIFVYPTIEKPRFAITLGLTLEPCSLGNRVNENFC